MVKKAEKMTQQARSAFEKWRDYFKPNIDQYHQMHSFVLGRQWTEDETKLLTGTFNKVPLQFNKLATLANTLLGEQQQNTPQLEVVPLSNCDAETAEIRQLLVKDISLSNDAKRVHQIAATQAIIGGFGAFIVDTDYCHEKSFELDIVYRSVKDPTKCYWDLGAEHPNKIDGMYAGYITRMSRKKFKQIYGGKVEEAISPDSQIVATKEEIVEATKVTSSPDDVFNWANNDGITILHHYARKYVTDKLYKMSNNKILTQQELDDLIVSSREYIDKLRNEQLEMMANDINGEMMGMAPEVPELPPVDENYHTLYDEGVMVTIQDSRDYKRSKIMHYKIAGDYILEKSEFPSEDLPIIFMDQSSYFDKTGKQHCRPFVVDAVDAQRYLNYLGTQCAYILKVSRYDQFIGSKANARSEGMDQQWKNPQDVKGLLTYDESPSGAKPEQLRPPELSVSLSNQYERAIQDMYTSTGLYPARMGQDGKEISGSAIDARTRQGSYSTYVVFNAINMAITAGGHIVNQMIPRVYDTERVVTLMKPDTGRENITINEEQDEYGEVIKNDIRKGTYEVKLQAGPSYEGQKEQALQSLQLVLNGNPEAFNLIADLFAANLPLTNTIEITNRLKTLVPPEIVQAGKTGQMPQQAQKSDPQADALAAEIQLKMQELELKKQKLQMEMQESQAKLQMEQKKLEMDHLQAMSDMESAKLRYLSELDRTRSDNAISHANNLTTLIAKHMEGMHKNAAKQSR